MNWPATIRFCRARVAELGADDRLTRFGTAILQTLETRLYLDERGAIVVGAAGCSYAVGASETLKNLALEFALLWHEHPDFPQCWMASDPVP
jgi:hypothetical protein